MTNGIPVLTVQADCIARAWELSLLKLYADGCYINTQYDKPGSLPSRDATMLITIDNPLMEPMIHLDMPGGFEDLQEYVMEVCDGIKDHWVRDKNNPDDHRWEYTYHQRLFGYDGDSWQTGTTFDQIENICEQLSKCLYTRRAQAITWKVWEDNNCYDPACLQSIWCRITETYGVPSLSMNVRFRSNDAYKAAFMNIFALVQLQQRIADRVTQIGGRKIELGRYCHLADSYHIYGSNMLEFESRFLNAIKTRLFGQRTVSYDSVKDVMKETVPNILEKVRKGSA